MIPERIKSCFLCREQRQNGENTLISGEIVCCRQHIFSVHARGRVQKELLGRMQLRPDEDGFAIAATCQRCGKDILIFDSEQDGYDHAFSINDKRPVYPAEQVCCSKCGGNAFCMDVGFEYPHEQELADLGCSEPDEAFTWIWISLICASCGRKHTDFVSCETA